MAPFWVTFVLFGRNSFPPLIGHTDFFSEVILHFAIFRFLIPPSSIPGNVECRSIVSFAPKRRRRSWTRSSRRCRWRSIRTTRCRLPRALLAERRRGAEMLKQTSSWFYFEPNFWPRDASPGFLIWAWTCSRPSAFTMKPWCQPIFV